MSRPIVASIRLDALRHNYRLAKNMQGGRALAVIKANAYGHGAVPCAKALADEADGFAVASLEEAIQLREAGIKAPILLLEGFFDVAELPAIVDNNCWIVIHASWQVAMLCAANLTQPLHVWLKMDSGMHRLGLAPSEYLSIYQQLMNSKNVKNIVLMSHFANADDINSAHTSQQIATFKHAICGFTTDESRLVEFSLANSAAILAWQSAQSTFYDASHCDRKNQWSRPGIMLYGANPLVLVPMNNPLRPVMQLHSKVIAIQKIKAGLAIGYGSLFTATCDTVVGVVACGYADGYPRTVINAPVAVNGYLTRVIGRVSMDMLFVDLTEIPTAHIGAMVELWGDQVSANDVASAAGTIAYELFCNVKRAKFDYSDATLT